MVLYSLFKFKMWNWYLYLTNNQIESVIKKHIIIILYIWVIHKKKQFSFFNY